jgi:multidrug efflux pump
VVARGHSLCRANEEVAKRVEQRLMAQEPGVKLRRHLGGLGRAAFYLPLDQTFPQTNVSQLIVLPRT